MIGCGAISGRHFQAINANKHAELVAVSDIIPRRAKTAGDLQGVDYYSKNSKLFDRSDINLVSICTPNVTHPAIATDAILSNKHVLSEKPLGIGLKEIDSLISLSKKSRKKVFVVHQVRYNEALKKAKELLDSGKLGKLLHSSLNVRWFRPKSYFSKKWYGKKSIAGGTLLNQGIHYIDVLSWVLGFPKAVNCFSKKLRYKTIGVEDFDTGTLFYPNGQLCNFEINVITYDRNKESTLLLLGEKGTIEVSGLAMNELTYWNVKNHKQPVLKMAQKPNFYSKGKYKGSVPNHHFVYNDVIKNLNGLKSAAVEASEGRKSIAIALKMYKSSSMGGKKIPIK